ncbi:MAG: hypothetical protein IPP31_13430 [Chitinophagaceae bacterium]|nr:hypothetical protein [Chitinophagaceae bacterium]
MPFVYFFAGCSSNSAPKHEAMPDQVVSERTAKHVNVKRSKCFIVPPEGSKRSDDLTQLYDFPGMSLTGINVSLAVKEASYPKNIEEMKAELNKDHNAVILVLKNIVFNGMPGLYYETCSMDKFYDAVIQVPLKDSTTLLIKGSYTNKTDGGTVENIFASMRSAYYDEKYKIDERTALEYQLDDSQSPFKYAGIEKRTFNFQWFTLQGKDYGSIGNEPYFLFFSPNKVYKSMKNIRREFMSYRYQLNLPAWGFKFDSPTALSGYGKTFKLSGHDAYEYLLPATDINGRRVTLLYTEVNYNTSTLVMMGVTAENDMKNIEEFRKLTATLKTDL